MELKVKHKFSRWIKITICFLFLFLPSSVWAGKVVVYGIDESGSYPFRLQSINIARNIIMNLKPGDILYLRWITDKSYDDSCSILRLEIPRVGGKVSNKFNKKAHYRQQFLIMRGKLLKQKAIRMLEETEPVKVKKTDIWGYLAAAADRIDCEHCRLGSCETKIVIASDMEDNCHLDPEIDLQGADVIIVGFKSGSDPTKTRKLKTAWKQKLMSRKASTVNFLFPDCKFFLNPHTVGKEFADDNQ